MMTITSNPIRNKTIEQLIRTHQKYEAENIIFNGVILWYHPRKQKVFLI